MRGARAAGRWAAWRRSPRRRCSILCCSAHHAAAASWVASAAPPCSCMRSIAAGDCRRPRAEARPSRAPSRCRRLSGNGRCAALPLPCHRTRSPAPARARRLGLRRALRRRAVPVSPAAVELRAALQRATTLAPTHVYRSAGRRVRLGVEAGLSSEGPGGSPESPALALAVLRRWLRPQREPLRTASRQCRCRECRRCGLRPGESAPRLPAMPGALRTRTAHTGRRATSAPPCAAPSGAPKPRNTRLSLTRTEQQLE